jgi:ferredoxin
VLWDCVRTGELITSVGSEGESLLSVAHRSDVPLEGACEGACACSTCHVILSEEVYASLPEPSDEENDLLDMAYGLSTTSRLGCQVKLRRDMEGIRVTVPSATRNFAVDGHVPQHH